MQLFMDKDISMAKTLWDGITLYFGFGRIHAQYGCIKLGIKRTTPMKSITTNELNSLDKHYRRKKFLVGRLLERDFYLRTSLLIEINAYRAIRAKQGLPNRGQRTHTNAKTAKKLSGIWQNTKYAKKMRKTNKKKTLFNFHTNLLKAKKRDQKRLKMQKKNRNKKVYTNKKKS